MSIKTTVESYLSRCPHQAGQTVQFGWFVFRIAGHGQPPQVESLDFRQIASFTQDFSETERIHTLQTATLARFSASECPCTLWQSALVSLSYSSKHANAFIERQKPTDNNDSGWYVGVRDETLNMDDPSSFARRSLYDLTIHDMRMAAYWLLPTGTVVLLDESA